MNTFIASICVLAFMSAVPAASEARQNPPVVATTGSAASDAPASVAGTTGAAPADYRLGAGDKIRVEVYKEPQLSQSLQVRPDGKITMPLIGDLEAAGQTPSAMRDTIADRLKNYVVNPVVTVMVVETLASTVYVMGQVNKPGTLPLTGPMSVLQALAMAGGFNEWANTKDIRILRNGPNGVETIHFNYKNALKGDGQMVYLQRGDTVIVR